MTRSKTLAFALSGALFMFGILFLSPCAQAQSVGIQISPPKIEELVEPGQVLQQRIDVTNNSDDARLMYVNLRDFKAGDESGRPVLIAPGSEEGSYLATWIDITSEGIEFAPHEKKTVYFFVNVPEEAGPGGYYGGIFFGTVPPRLDLNTEDRGAGMSIAQQNGTLLLLQVKGEVDENAMVREFNTDKEFYGTPYEVNFTLRVENTGNVHIRPFGQIDITNMFGRKVAQVNVNHGGNNALPKSIRSFPGITWADERGFGRYQADLILAYGISVNEGGQGMKTMVSTKYFWIMPWNIIVPLFATTIFVIGLFVFSLRMYKNKAIKKAMDQMGLVHGRGRHQAPSPTGHMMIIFTIVFAVVFVSMSAAYFLFFS